MSLWVKLWSDERGDFADCTAIARGMAAELLKLCDDDGVIKFNGRKFKPADAVCSRLGTNHPRDRRLMPELLEELREADYLDIEANKIVVKNFARYQNANRSHETKRSATRNEPSTNSHENDTSPLPTTHEFTTNPTPTTHEFTTNSLRDQNESLPKLMISLSSCPVEESRVEEIRVDKKSSTSSYADPRDAEVLDVTIPWIVCGQAYEKTKLANGGLPSVLWPHEKFYRVVGGLAVAAASRSGKTVGEVATAWAEAYFTERDVREPRWWAEWAERHANARPLEQRAPRGKLSSFRQPSSAEEHAKYAIPWAEDPFNPESGVTFDDFAARNSRSNPVES